MKKILLLLTCLLTIGIYGNAAETTIDFSKISFTNNKYTTPDGVITVTLGGSGNDKATINSGVLRFYASNEMTISVANGSITEINITTSGSYAWGKLTIDGKVADGVTANSSTKDSTNKKWSFEDETPEITLVNRNTAQVRMASIKITYDVIEKAVADVLISTAEISGETYVSLSCPTPGATIYYGFAENAQTNEYSSRFKVTEKCTVYAHAELNGVSGKVSIESITPAIRYTNFKEALAAGNNDKIWIIGNFTVAASIGQNLLLTDGASFMLLYGTNSYAVGDNISTVRGTVTPYNDLFELQNFTLTKGGTGAESTFKSINSLNDINYNDNLFEGVSMSGCTISGKNGNNATITFNGETVALYNRYGVTFENGENFTIKGVVSRNNNVLQIVPIKIEGGIYMETVKNPEISPKQRELKDGDLISISCATEGARIYYTLDKEEPTEESNLYSGPFEFDVKGIGVGTIKVRAFPAEGVDNMLPSEIIEKTYRLFDPTCNVLNTEDHEHKGTEYSKSHTCIIDDVEYEMNALHHAEYSSIQVNGKSQTIYIIQTSENEGYVLDRIDIDYDLDHISKSTTIAEFAVVGSNEPLTDTNYSTTGEKIGTITKDANSVTFTNDYKYFAIYTTKSSGATYLNNITIYYRLFEESQAPELPEDLEIISDENGLLIDEIPTAKNWTAMFSINDGTEYNFVENEGMYEAALEAATTHSIKIWYVNDISGVKSNIKEYFHLTAPQFNFFKDTNSEESKISIDFGKIGEGVNVYFTLDGSAPQVPTQEAQQQSKMRKVVARAAAADGVYTIDGDDDLEGTHVITSDSPKVDIKNLSADKAVTLSSVAHDPANNLQSTPTVSDTPITTGVQIIVKDTEAEYFTIDGMKVNGNLAKGIYLVRKNGKVTKMMVK